MKSHAPAPLPAQRRPAAAAHDRESPVSTGNGLDPPPRHALQSYIDRSARMTAQRRSIEATRNGGSPIRPRDLGDAAPVQLRCNPQQLAWQSNFQASGLTVDGLFTAEDLQSGDSRNNEDRGTLAHELIQEKHGSWIPEYGIPPSASQSGWRYADMAKDLQIYEIKPDGGIEDAVAQATSYVERANLHKLGHVLASTAIDRRELMLEKRVERRDFLTHDLENDNFQLFLNYKSNRPGEVVYSWEIVNESARARQTEREKQKRVAKKEEEGKQRDERTRKEHHDLRSMFKATSRTPKSSTVTPSTLMSSAATSSTVTPSMGTGVMPSMQAESEPPRSRPSESTSEDERLDAEANLLADQGVYHVAELRQMRQTSQIQGMVHIIDQLIEGSRGEPHGESEPFFYYGRLRW